MSDYYIDGLNGDDAAAGSEAAPWKTIGKAITNPIAGGDRVFIKASATYTEDNNFSGIDGAIATPIVLEGYATTPGDNGRATIANGGASRTLQLGDWYAVRNLVVGGGSSSCFTGGTGALFDNCEAAGTGTTNWGFECGTGTYLVGCYAHDCDTKGYSLTGIGGAFSCIADNTNFSFRPVGKTYGFFYCIARNGGNRGIMTGEPIVNCTVDAVNRGNAVGIEVFGTNVPNAVINCVVTRCATGFLLVTGIGNKRNFAFNNAAYDNDTDYSGGDNVSGGVTADVKFVDQDNKDYGPDTGSPLIMAGLDGLSQTWLGNMTGDAIDIGALQSEPIGSNLKGAFFNWGVN